MASDGQYMAPVGHDKVIKAVTHGYGYITHLQIILQQLPHGDPWSELARHVSQEAADSLFEALCFLEPAGRSPVETPCPLQVAATPVLSNIYEVLDVDQITACPFAQDSSNPKGKRCDVHESFRKVTVWPDYVDRYQWRKYGQKKIRGTNFVRNYYRCTHFNDQGCSATKRVQQIDNDDPPKFLVAYYGEHTCNYSSSTTNTLAANFQDMAAFPTVNLQQGNMLCFNSTYPEMKKEQVVPSGSTDQAFNTWMVLDSCGGLVISKRDELASSSMVENYYSSSELTSTGSVVNSCADHQENSYTTYPFPILDGMGMVCRELMEFVEFDVNDVNMKSF